MNQPFGSGTIGDRYFASSISYGRGARYGEEWVGSPFEDSPPDGTVLWYHYFMKSKLTTPEEQDVLDHILAAMRGIQDLGLNCNEAELSRAVHTLQGFVMVRMLNRLDPDYWSDWYEV